MTGGAQWTSSENFEWYGLARWITVTPGREVGFPLPASIWKRLLALAQQDRRQFFARNPGWAQYYVDRILGTALCQGAACHYVRGDVGINDFDVYTFYAANPERTWYAKRIARLDFGSAKFGCSEVSGRSCLGRRVDLLGRALNVPSGADLTESLRAFLKSPKTGTSWELRKKAVVLLEPRMGEIVWPVNRGTIEADGT